MLNNVLTLIKNQKHILYMQNILTSVKQEVEICGKTAFSFVSLFQLTDKNVKSHLLFVMFSRLQALL